MIGPIKGSFPSLFTLSKNPQIMPHKALTLGRQGRGWESLFFINPPQPSLQDFTRRIDSYYPSLTNSLRDKGIQAGDQIREFLVKSTYMTLSRTKGDSQRSYIFWHPSLTSRIQIFQWIIFHNKQLTSDNLQKRGWIGNHLCSFCLSSQET